MAYSKSEIEQLKDNNDLELIYYSDIKKIALFSFKCKNSYKGVYCLLYDEVGDNSIKCISDKIYRTTNKTYLKHRFSQKIHEFNGLTWSDGKKLVDIKKLLRRK